MGDADVGVGQHRLGGLNVIVGEFWRTTLGAARAPGGGAVHTIGGACIHLIRGFTNSIAVAKGIKK